MSCSALSRLSGVCKLKAIKLLRWGCVAGVVLVCMGYLSNRMAEISNGGLMPVRVPPDMTIPSAYFITAGHMIETPATRYKVLTDILLIVRHTPNSIIIQGYSVGDILYYMGMVLFTIGLTCLAVNIVVNLLRNSPLKEVVR